MEYSTPAFQENYKLNDGTNITIRAINANDKPLLKDFFRNLSNELKHLNYMESFKEIPDNLLYGIMRMDYKNSVTFIVTTKTNNKEEMIGLAHYITTEEHKEDCDCDIIIAEPWQNRGIGRILTKILINAAKENKMNMLKLDILNSNLGGMQLAKAFGFKISKSDEPTINTLEKVL